MAANYIFLNQKGMQNETKYSWISIAPPIWLCSAACFIFTLFRRSWTLHKKMTFSLKNFFIFVHWIWWEGFTFHQKPCYNYTRNLKLQRRIQNPAKYLKWNVFRKSLMARSRGLWKRSILDAWQCSEYVSKLGMTVAGQE